MSYFIIDRRDREAQRVTESATVADDVNLWPGVKRFVKVHAADVAEAFALAGLAPK